MERQHLTTLRKILTTRFNESELRTLCFDLGVDYDGLRGTGKADKARELVAYCERHKGIAKLVALGKQLRPDIDWSKVPEENVGISTSITKTFRETFERRGRFARLGKLGFVLILLAILALGLIGLTPLGSTVRSVFYNLVSGPGDGESATATPTSSRMPTDIPKPTVTVTSGPVVTLEPVDAPTQAPSTTGPAMTRQPTIEPPNLIAPPDGAIAKRTSPELRWQGTVLPSDCNFVVRLQHAESGDVISSRELNADHWTPPLPVEKHGWWSWRVQVVRHAAQDVTVVATSDAWQFCFDPFPSESPLAPP